MSTIRRVFGALMILALISVTVWLPTGPLQPAGQADLRSAAGGPAAGACPRSRKRLTISW